MLYIKGFDENLCCRGFQFEVGETYHTGYTEDLELCSCTVFHFCKSIQQVHDYYDVRPDRKNRFCYVEALGEVVESSDKCGSNKIKIVREIKGQELKQLLGLINGNTGLFNTGDCNTGDWNQCDRSTGLFNTKERTVTIFNKDSGLLFDEVRDTEWYYLLRNRPFVLNEWIEYTEEEKEGSIIRQAIGGYLKEYSYKEACQNWWNSYSDEEKEYLAENIPNFDREIFKEITGIDYGN